METEKVKQFEEKMEKLRIAGLERQNFEMLKNSRWGRIYITIYLFIGVGSIFLYKMFFNLNIIFSIFLGFITWFAVSWIVDTILIKTQRIDKQLDYLLKTQKGIAMLKEKGMTDEQIEKLKTEIENNPLLKKFSLENKN